MSLLMEALKKAEEAKRQSTDGHQSSASSVAFWPADETATAPDGERIPENFGNPPQPDSSPHFDANDIGIAPAPRHAPARTTPAADDHRTAARNLFAAKRPPRNTKGLWLIAGLGLFAALGLGGYFWWQLQEIPSRTLANPLPPTAASSKPSASASPTSTTSIAGTPASLVPSPQPTTVLPPGEQRLLGTNLPTNPGTSSGVAADRTQKPPSPPAAPISPTISDTPIRLSRTQPRTDPALERAYDALQAGRANEAQRDYEQVLRNDPKNTDALLGLATIAAQQGQTEKAHVYYLRALESNPNDPTAKAGAISMRGQADGDSSESRLKTALSSQPDSPPLLFALGNLYARQERWSEAQQVYFRAYATEPDNPDFIFNLAISLDHLRQNKLAGQYYQMALTAGETRTVSFDRHQARNRILELQP